MVPVPGSSGDSGFHRESQADVKVKEKYREEVSTNAGSTEASLTAAAVTADLDENLDPHTTDKDTTKSKSNLSTKSTASTKTYKKIKIKAARTKLKVEDTRFGILRRA
ncbi:hypothetical protein PHMEG_00013523 [Phytophthora megakarya]|uniref:Uncharacterized protein n=1 Tax=Phytophthora megakarya TaxID=4795 RepID=A0A225W624_9STRA|nr:hypothetical protein PHMEG_00013523 [Phytophthora megakarya]